MTGEFVKRGGIWVAGQIVLMLLNFAGPLWHRAQPGFLLTLCSMFLLAVKRHRESSGPPTSAEPDPFPGYFSDGNQNFTRFICTCSGCLFAPL